MQHDMNRRTMLAHSMLAAAGVVLCGCSVGDNPTAPNTVSSLTLKLSDYPALANVGGVVLVTASGSPLAVVRTSATTFVALSRICPHQGATVGTVTGGFLCPRHGAEFSSNGTWIGGQPTSSMHGYVTAFDATAGTVTVG
jgi:Rieske Fe-S protein